MEWMKNLSPKACKTGEIVQNTFDDTLAAAEESLQRPEWYKFVIREKYFACLQDKLPLLVEVYTKKGYEFIVEQDWDCGSG